MQQQHSTLYIIGFSAAVCVVCSLLVSTTAVSLKSRQERNAALDMQKSVLRAAGLIEPGETADAQKIASLFEQIQVKVINIETGEPVDVDPDTVNPRQAVKNPDASIEAPENNAGITRLPKLIRVYEVVKGGSVTRIVIPIFGKGLWSTMYGFLALASDGNTIEGITFYDHGETPGLGGEVDNPRWQSLWEGREAYDDSGDVAIEVIKGTAPPPDKAPHKIDGLSGATITGRGVSHFVRFWLSQDGLGPYLDRYQ